MPLFLIYSYIQIFCKFTHSYICLNSIVRMQFFEFHEILHEQRGVTCALINVAYH
jgi:hypothetical protein